MLKRQQFKLTEDNLQLFTKCSRIQKIWTHYQPILTKLIGKTYTPQQHVLTLNVKNTNKDTRKLTLTIIQIILFEIRQSRNNNKYDKNLLPQHTITTKTNAQPRPSARSLMLRGKIFQKRAISRRVEATQFKTKSILKRSQQYIHTLHNVERDLLGTSKISFKSLSTSDVNSFRGAFNDEIIFIASFIPTCFSSTIFLKIFIWVSNLNLSRSLLKSKDIVKVQD